MLLNNWLARLLQEKLEGKCNKEEIADIISSIVQRQYQEDMIQFVRKEDYKVCTYTVRDIIAVEELKRGKYFSFVIKGWKFEDCYLANKKFDRDDLFKIMNKHSDEFTQVDSKTLVKLSKVNRYNSDNGQLFFDIPGEDTKEIMMQANMSSMRLVRREVGLDRDIALKTSFHAARGGWEYKKHST